MKAIKKSLPFCAGCLSFVYICIAVVDPHIPLIKVLSY